MENKKVIAHDMFQKEYEINKDGLNMSTHIYGIAIKNNQLLIVPQFEGFDLPGGTAEKGETHIETLKREFKEETGYTIEPQKLLNVYTSFFHHPMENKDYQCYMIYYLVNILDGEISTEGFDDYEKEYAQTAKWVDINKLKQMKHICSINIIDELLKMINQ